MLSIKFCTKKSEAQLSISSMAGATGLQILSSMKYYTVLKWESRFTLWLDAAINTHYIKKGFK